MILWKRSTWVFCLYDGWEWGDLQWQNSLDESLTFWASEVSWQQQALKNRDCFNWLKTTARRNERKKKKMTMGLRENHPSQPLCIKPNQGVVENTNKRFILSFSASMFILPLTIHSAWPKYSIKFHSQTVLCLPESLKLSCFCHGNWIMLAISLSFVLAGNLTPNSFSWGQSLVQPPETVIMSPVCLERWHFQSLSPLNKTIRLG